MDQQYSGQSLLDLEVDPPVSRAFRDAARWAKFIAIVYAVCFGILLVAGIFGGAALATELADRMEEYQSPYASLIANGLLLIIVVAAVIGGVLVYFLFRFSAHTKAGLERQEQSLFISGLKSLKNYFIIYGVVAILLLLLGLATQIFTLISTTE